ncbi:MAG: XRE family transcriptional regulator [Alphaproteobacteria bacterium]|nr:XRE family transcriptional regulator [Alphaproteobacteria bacterium]NDC57053.1 XRE family transcriptional regulator [Alphaproteobacteria bacterium]
MANLDPEVEAREGFLTFLKSQRGALHHIADTSDDNFVLAVSIVSRAGLPQAEVAKKIGVSQSTISRWSKGVNLPSNSIIRKALFSELIKAFDEYVLKMTNPDARVDEPEPPLAHGARHMRRNARAPV